MGRLLAFYGDDSDKVRLKVASRAASVSGSIGVVSEDCKSVKIIVNGELVIKEDLSWGKPTEFIRVLSEVIEKHELEYVTINIFDKFDKLIADRNDKFYFYSTLHSLTGRKKGRTIFVATSDSRNEKVSGIRGGLMYDTKTKVEGAEDINWVLKKPLYLAD